MRWFEKFFSAAGPPPSEADPLQRIGHQLDAAVAARQRAESALRAALDGHERRAVELAAANQALAAEAAARGQAAEALAASELRFRRVVDSNMLGILFWNAAGEITEANQRFLDMLGYTAGDLASGQVSRRSLSPPEYAQADERAWSELAARGSCTPYEKEYRCRDGSRRPVLVGGATFGGAGGGGVAFALDMSASRRMGEVKDRLAAIITSSQDAIISKDTTGIITSWNRAAEAIFGYPAAEIVGRSMQVLIPPERAEEEPLILQRIGRGESVEHFETVRRRKDGRHITVSVTVSPIRDGGGRIIGASKIARDVTAKNQAEARLQAQLGRLDLLNRITRAIGQHQDLPSIFQAVLRSLEERLQVDFCCMCRYDQAAGELAVANVGARSEALARSLMMPVEATIAIDGDGLAQCLAGRLVHEPDMTLNALPFPRRLVAGGLRAFVGAPLVVGGEVVAVLVVARRQAESFSSGECEFLQQLSEHVALAAHQSRLHAALQASYDELRQTQQAVLDQERLRALGQMASGIAHDINNAIAPSLLYTEMLLEKEPGLSGKGRKQLEVIARALGDVAHTVARLGDFYHQRERLDAPATVDLDELVGQVVELTRARWSDIPQQRGVVVAVTVQLAGELPRVAGSASEIREALINLVFNAVDAMPAGGTITVRTRSGADPDGRQEVQLEVEDSGVGMGEETRRRCLEPFYTTKGERGSGLGLAMVFGIAQRHGARLDIDSAVGRGTTVRLSFPRAAAAAAAPPAPSEPAAPTAALRILVIDDDPLVLASLRESLEGDGHAVVAADQGEAGIAAFRAAHATAAAFAVVFTDLGMPHLDGREVAAAIKAISPPTPVLLLTGWGRNLAAAGDLPACVDAVLSKPPRQQELRQALARHCGGRSA